MFDENIGRRLKEKQPIYIDHNENIFDKNEQYLGNYKQIKIKTSSSNQEQKTTGVKQEEPQFTMN